jgi:hypothetical protein
MLGLSVFWMVVWAEQRLVFWHKATVATIPQ